MRELNTGLTNYDDINNDHKIVYKNMIVIFLVLLVIIATLTIIFNNIFHILIGYIIGCISSVALFYLTSKLINQTYYLDYKKVARKIHILYMLTYLLVFVGIALIFKDYFIIIGLTIGLLLNRASILLSFINKK